MQSMVPRFRQLQRWIAWGSAARCLNKKQNQPQWADSFCEPVIEAGFCLSDIYNRSKRAENPILLHTTFLSCERGHQTMRSAPQSVRKKTLTRVWWRLRVGRGGLVAGAVPYPVRLKFLLLTTTSIRHRHFPPNYTSIVISARGLMDSKCALPRRKRKRIAPRQPDD